MDEVIFVGTSDAFGSGGRRQSAILVRGPRGSILMDCGATTNTGLADLGIDRNEIDLILISHFHSDHFGGLPLFLLAALYQDQRRHPLAIVGPPEIEERVRGLARAMGHDLDSRQWPFPLSFHEVGLAGEQEFGPAQVRAFQTQHQADARPHGYQVSLGGPTIAYSGDTGWFDALPERVAGADLFVCECTFLNRALDFHLSLDEISEHRATMDVGRLILTHLGSEMVAQREEIDFETADDGLRLGL
ncbi:MAG: MBL fold metallo-hydrolase [Myxococcota bacterium]|nr:MBL fold metallo-hydrolase [Myxococcota bacterium]